MCASSSDCVANVYGLYSPGTENRCRDFPAVQNGPWAHPASCKMSNKSFPWVCSRSVLLTLTPSSTAVMEEQSYNSTHLLGHTGTVKGSLYLYLFYIQCVCVVNDKIGNRAHYTPSLTRLRIRFASTCRLLNEWDCELQYSCLWEKTQIFIKFPYLTFVFRSMNLVQKLPHFFHGLSNS